jgi:lipid-binding SYLF domain-containing protein
MRTANLRRFVLFAAAAAVVVAGRSAAQTTEDDSKLADAGGVLHTFTANEERGIPRELLERARGIAVVPSLIRGGFFVGGRRGRGVLAVRLDDGSWSNPAFITLTGGSIGWQFGAESADVVLIFANDRSVKNIESGKFTFGGDATAIAGPLDRRSTKAVTFKSEIYVYLRSRGLFAGAAFEGTRLDIDQQGSAEFYAASGGRALGPVGSGTPESARRFLAVLTNAELPLAPSTTRNRPAEPSRERSEEAGTFPLE